jgi:hypothetical protein
VTVQVEGIAVKTRFDALDAGPSGCRNDAIPAGDRIRARTFKIFPHVSA